MGGKFLTKANVSAIIADYKAGMLVADISKKYKVCNSYPPMLVRRHGHPGRLNKRLALDEFQKAEQYILDDYYNGMLLKQLKHKYSMGLGRIYTLLKYRGLKLRTRLGKG